MSIRDIISDIMTISPLALAQALIRCPSITPADAGAQDVLIEALRAMGFECHTLTFGKVKNLFARLGTGKPHLCFAGHTDVVPAGDESAWTHPPFSAAVANGKLYGRGASDMKGNIACFVAALSRFVEKNGSPPGSVSLLITGDEEAEAVDGTIRVLPWMKENNHLPDVTIVGEPSNPNALGDEIKIGRRGSLVGKLAVRGKQGHIAYPERADNPLPRLIALLAALDAHAFDAGTEFFQPTNLEIVSIDVGNAADNVIPAAGSALFGIRFNDLWTCASLEKKVREILDATGHAYELICRHSGECFRTAPGPFTAMFSDAIRSVTGRIPALTTGGGTSDARFIKNYCPAVVEFGLINRTIHQVDEHAAVEDIGKLTEIYSIVLERYFSG